MILSDVHNEDISKCLLNTIRELSFYVEKNVDLDSWVHVWYHKGDIKIVAKMLRNLDYFYGIGNKY